MIISPKKVWFDEASLWVELSDARTIGVPLAWFTRLLEASPAQREAFELDEDISVQGLLEGRGDMTREPRQVA